MLHESPPSSLGSGGDGSREKASKHETFDKSQVFYKKRKQLKFISWL